MLQQLVEDAGKMDILKECALKKSHILVYNVW